MTASELWSDPARGLTARLHRAPTEAAVALLSRTVWGSRDTRYRILDIGDKLRLLRDPHVFELTAGGRLASVCVLDRCEKQAAGRTLDAFHFAMAATDEAVAGEGLATVLLDRVKAFCVATLRPPGVGFAYIEASTDISLGLSDNLGHALEAELPLTLFTRLFPRADDAVGPARAEERAEMVARLDELYRGHAFTDFSRSVDPARMLVLREGGRIRAAVRVERLRWSVTALPGLSGALLLRLLPLIPWVNRRLNPRDLGFLRFGDVLCEPGEEAALERLLETALARERAALGLMMFDARSPVLARLRKGVAMGPLRHVISGSAKLRADFVGMEAAEIAEITALPVAVGAADVF